MPPRKYRIRCQEQTGAQKFVRAFESTVKAGSLELCQTINQIAGDHTLIIHFHDSRKMNQS